MTDKWNILGETAKSILEDCHAQLANASKDIDQIKDKEQQEYIQSVITRSEDAVKKNDPQKINELIVEVQTNITKEV